MANSSVLQVRMDPQLKRSVEQLYRDLGTSFPEAVRIFAQQSLLHRGLPFNPTGRTAASSQLTQARDQQGNPSTADKQAHQTAEQPPNAFGMFSAYADDARREQESRAWEQAAQRKHGKAVEL